MSAQRISCFFQTPLFYGNLWRSVIKSKRKKSRGLHRVRHQLSLRTDLEKKDVQKASSEFFSKEEDLGKGRGWMEGIMGRLRCRHSIRGVNGIC